MADLILCQIHILMTKALVKMYVLDVITYQLLNTSDGLE